MRRVPAMPRTDWLSTVEAQGLTYAVDRGESGDTTAQYWHEDARYEFSAREIECLEQVTADLHDMAVQAAHKMVTDPALINRHGLPAGAAELLARSLADGDDISLYGRFDLAWDGNGHAKMLEYNADTPAGLVEAAVCQWMWLEDLHPANDQWNMLHERFLQAFTNLRTTTGIEAMHFAVGQNEPTEDWATVAYLRDTAQETGLVALGITMEEIGWDSDNHEFVDIAGLPITHCFKMYPTEWLLDSEFGKHVISGAAKTRWIEPAYKLLLGSKALLPVMWDMFPNHPNLLPAYFDHPHGMNAYVTKPLFGWEGDGVAIHTPNVSETAVSTHTAGQQVIYQEFVNLPNFNGNHPVLGTWVVGGHAAGLGVRESSNLITNTNARFVPHLITSPRSSDEQVAAWLAQD